MNTDQKPTIPEVLPIIQEYYQKPGNGVGGNLHIVLEDGNIENRHIRSCLRRARENEDLEGIKIAELLLRMSKTQRRKLYFSPKHPDETEGGRAVTEEGSQVNSDWRHPNVVFAHNFHIQSVVEKEQQDAALRLGTNKGMTDFEANIGKRSD